MQKKNILILLILILALPLTVYLTLQQQNVRQHAQEAPKIFMIPGSEELGPNQSLSISFVVKTLTSPISGVQLNLVYPQEKLGYISTTTEGTAFPIQSEGIVRDGLLQLGRDTEIPVTGEKFIATIIFTTKQMIHVSEIRSAPGTSVIQIDDKRIPAELVVGDPSTQVVKEPKAAPFWVTMFDPILNLFK